MPKCIFIFLSGYMPAVISGKPIALVVTTMNHKTPEVTDHLQWMVNGELTLHRNNMTNSLWLSA